MKSVRISLSANQRHQLEPLFQKIRAMVSEGIILGQVDHGWFPDDPGNTYLHVCVVQRETGKRIRKVIQRDPLHAAKSDVGTAEVGK